MKQITAILLLLLAFSLSKGQIDKNGNPTFNSQILGTEDHGEFQLSRSYYTITNNIDNKESSVFIAENPSAEQYLDFARDQTSYFFIIHKGQELMTMVILLQNNEQQPTQFAYNIFNPHNKQSVIAPCNVWGEITEKRAEELIALKIDSTAKIIDLPMNGKGLMFNGIVYRIQPYDKLLAEVTDLATQLVESKGPEKEDPAEVLRRESIGGKFDFKKQLEKEDHAFFLLEGVSYNKDHFAILLWGQTALQLGIKSAKKAKKLWQEIYDRKMNKAEEKALIKGFELQEE